MFRIFIHDGIALNIDNDEDAERLLSNGARELTNEEIAAAGMAGYEHLVSPSNTTISEDGGITFTPPEPPSLEEVKAKKLEELRRAWLAAEDNGVVQSSLGFTIDATERSNRDIDGLIKDMEASGGETTVFCDAVNSFHEVTLADLKTMQLEVIRHGQAIYARKWELRTAIESAETAEAVEAVEISFGEAIA